eukprot:101128-Rhodomonas_salina.1
MLCSRRRVSMRRGGKSGEACGALAPTAAPRPNHMRASTVSAQPVPVACVSGVNAPAEGEGPAEPCRRRLARGQSPAG